MRPIACQVRQRVIQTKQSDLALLHPDTKMKKRCDLHHTAS
jgi:hypothetical protein